MKSLLLIWMESSQDVNLISRWELCCELGGEPSDSSKVWRTQSTAAHFAGQKRNSRNPRTQKFNTLNSKFELS